MKQFLEDLNELEAEIYGIEREFTLKKIEEVESLTTSFKQLTFKKNPHKNMKRIVEKNQILAKDMEEVEFEIIE